jgi:hypothetical protein
MIRAKTLKKQLNCVEEACFITLIIDDLSLKVINKKGKSYLVLSQ